jgi:hypothetical protein
MGKNDLFRLEFGNGDSILLIFQKVLKKYKNKCGKYPAKMTFFPQGENFDGQTFLHDPGNNQMISYLIVIISSSE